ncbi:hypothetical protein F4553_002294 [Allocatelliglobosispora scoriae]|uniref:DUF4440 domain-containing protein n=1 Tax=Allocatelliglobosispora scoriae TaxID=643052 RepID=A0A841BMM3_9ACTN|nr:hypothetical protein [Allocatelliglobosispora scoriae]MBB5868915.1 hypothetical protein [Allocatelliglobosispora scoriae]
MVHDELAELLGAFLAAVSFRRGERPGYGRIHDLFLPEGLLIRNSGPAPEVTTVAQFIEPRQATVDSGALTEFEEVETAARTEVFGQVAHRFSAYAKRGVLDGVPFAGAGMISTQCVLTPLGWRISSMAWDDERPGLTVAEIEMPDSARAA